MNWTGGRLAIVVLLAVAAVGALLIERAGPPSKPAMRLLPADEDLGGPGQVIAPEHRSTGLAATVDRLASSVGEVTVAARELSVRVDRGIEQLLTEPLTVELLFGSQLTAQPKAMRLAIDASGRATLPLGVGADLPFRAEFAFPTLGGSGRAIDAAAGQEVELVLPPCGQLEFEVVEVDGSATAEAAIVEVRHANAPWPANRWLAVPIEHGRGTCPAEVGEYALEVRVRGASQRQAKATVRGPGEVGARVSRQLTLPAGPALVLQPQLIAPVSFDGSVRVMVHLLAPDVSLVAHTLPERPGCFAVHPAPALSRTGWTVVQVTGRSLDDPDRGWSGESSLDLARSMDLLEPIVVQVRPVTFGR